MSKLTLSGYIEKGKKLAIPKKEQAEIERLFHKSVGNSDESMRLLTTMFPNLTGENQTGLLFEIDSKFILIPIEQVKTAIEKVLSDHGVTQREIDTDLGRDFDYTGFKSAVQERVSSLLDFVVSKK